MRLKSGDIAPGSTSKTSLETASASTAFGAIRCCCGVESSAAKIAMSALHPGTFIKAHLEGFLQRSVDGDFFLMPAEFLIQTDGKIHTAHYAAHLSDRLTASEIMSFLFKKAAP